MLIRNTDFKPTLHCLPYSFMLAFFYEDFSALQHAGPEAPRIQ
jgi:hypothetical protein